MNVAAFKLFVAINLKKLKSRSAREGREASLKLQSLRQARSLDLDVALFNHCLPDR